MIPYDVCQASLVLFIFPPPSLSVFPSFSNSKLNTFSPASFFTFLPSQHMYFAIGLSGPYLLPSMAVFYSVFCNYCRLQTTCEDFEQGTTHEREHVVLSLDQCIIFSSPSFNRKFDDFSLYLNNILLCICRYTTHSSGHLFTFLFQVTF